MPERVQKPRTRVTKNTRTEVIQDRTTKSEAKRKAIRQELHDELDGMLEDIDGVLEQNAEEFVRSYVQKGGQ